MSTTTAIPYTRPVNYPRSKTTNCPHPDNQLNPWTDTRPSKYWPTPTRRQPPNRRPPPTRRIAPPTTTTTSTTTTQQPTIYHYDWRATAQALHDTSPGLSECTEDQAACASGDCIAREYVCDGEYDCADASDENDCGTCLLSIF